MGNFWMVRRSRPAKANFIDFTVAFFLAAAIFLAHAPRARASEDAMESSTTIASGTLIQSFLMSRHFMRSPGPEDTFFNRVRNYQEEETHPEMRKKPDEPTSLAWRLGYAYNRVATPATALDPEITSQTHTLQVGFDWDPLDRLRLSAHIWGDHVVEESYLAGHFEFRGAWRIFLVGETPEEREARLDREAAGLDASEFYRRYQDSYRPPPQEPEQVVFLDSDDDEDSRTVEALSYPNLTLGLKIGLDRHHKTPELVRRVTRGTLATGLVVANAFRWCADGVIALDEKFSLRAAVELSLYDRNMDTFANFLEQAGRRGIAALAGGGVRSARAMSFPLLSLDQSAEWDLGQVGTFEVNLNEMVYAVSQGASVTLNPTFFRSLSKSWRVGLGVSIGLASGDAFVGGSADLIYYL